MHNKELDKFGKNFEAAVGGASGPPNIGWRGQMEISKNQLGPQHAQATIRLYREHNQNIDLALYNLFLDITHGHRAVSQRPRASVTVRSKILRLRKPYIQTRTQ